MIEAGVPGYDVASWNAMAAPAKTPRAVIDRVNQELRKAIAAPEVQKRFGELGVDAHEHARRSCASSSSPSAGGGRGRGQASAWSRPAKIPNRALTPIRYFRFFAKKSSVRFQASSAACGLYSAAATGRFGPTAVSLAKACFAS